MFIVTILTIPMFNTFLSSIICVNDLNNTHSLDCGSGLSIINSIFGVIGLLL